VLDYFQLQDAPSLEDLKTEPKSMDSNGRQILKPIPQLNKRRIHTFSAGLQPFEAVN